MLLLRRASFLKNSGYGSPLSNAGFIFPTNTTPDLPFCRNARQLPKCRHLLGVVG